jgi:pyruvate dehydrogenase E2 component (dihydrolipoamide acetyltransferase)
MPTDVIMPQMGESIFEGTITKWLKKPGEKVQRDEPLFEISTDKVDAEIPAPTSGVLQEIKVPEGSTVQVNSVVGVIAADGEGSATPAPAATQAAPTQPAPTGGGGDGASGVSEKPEASSQAGPEAQTQSAGQGATAPPAEAIVEYPDAAVEEGERVRSSPLVRKIAKEHNVDLRQVSGTGLGGRITKDDILNFVEKHSAGAPAPAAPAPVRPATAAPTPEPAAAPPSAPAPRPAAELPGEVVPMTQMRKIIAERMVESKRTSAHVHSVFEVDMTRVVNLRNKLKSDFEKRTGTKLTFMPFFCRAAIHGIRNWPIVNASVEGDSIRYHRHINIGIAVALDWGLIVPVIKNAEELNFLGLQRAITDLAERARIKKLKPDDVQGGTFTITNPGSYGQMFGLPIIVQPQVAIMGVGSIKKMPVVVTDMNGMDSIAIRSICHLSLGYDHRVVDGAIADQFLRDVAKYLENWNEDLG